MLSTEDRAQMTSDLTAIRNDNPVSITIRRGQTSLPAQTVRIARAGSSTGLQVDSGPSQETRGQVIVLFAPDGDVATGDKFNVGLDLYEITYVRPNRRERIEAEARLIT